MFIVTEYAALNDMASLYDWHGLAVGYLESAILLRKLQSSLNIGILSFVV